MNKKGFDLSLHFIGYMIAVIATILIVLVIAYVMFKKVG